MKAKLIITSRNHMYLIRKDAQEAVRRISKQVIISSSFLMNEKEYDDIIKWTSGK